MKKSKCKGPLLTNLSSYKSSPKWTISAQVPRSVTSVTNGVSVGPAAYNPISCIDKTSKFRKISPACSFGTSKRFYGFGSLASEIESFPGPGQYSPPPDFSRAPFHSICNISFGVGERAGPGGRLKRNDAPGPGAYDIRGKYRAGGYTFSDRGVSVNERHGWFYDEDVKATRHNPAPGTYNPRTPDENQDRRITFGIGYRPKLDRPASRGIPSPGRYELKSTLGTRSFSFTHGVKKTQIRSEHTVGAICAQPTQFG